MLTNDVETSLLFSSKALPLVVRPRQSGMDPADWASRNVAALEATLDQYGAVLFRDFGFDDVAAFESFASAICPTLYGEYQDLPKEATGTKTYRATPYPAEKTILFHNESSHMHRFPVKQFFYCALASLTGGETPVADGREIYRRLRPELREEFEKKNLMYVRNFVPGFDVSWQDFFHTENLSEVEEYCRARGIEVEVRDGGIQTRQIAPAVVRHIRTREPVFFNQIQLHHIACVEPDLKEALLMVLGEEKMPRRVLFGDGSPIPDSVVEEILALYWECSVAAPWQNHDVLMVDNMLCSHARNPFTGPRKIVVAMGEIVRSEQVL